MKFVIRLLGSAGELLAWKAFEAKPFPQGRPRSCPWWPEGRQTKLIVEQTGVVTQMSVHWCDCDVARVRPMDSIQVVAGQEVTFTWVEPVWMVGGMPNVPLPEVTETAGITVGVPPAAIGARATV